jgi:hypothetical protein
MKHGLAVVILSLAELREECGLPGHKGLSRSAAQESKLGLLPAPPQTPDRLLEADIRRCDRSRPRGRFRRHASSEPPEIRRESAVVSAVSDDLRRKWPGGERLVPRAGSDS